MIKDTGIGIDEETQKHLFNPFTQAESSTTRKYGGTGLGLSIVKQLCELMGGKIKLSSQLGKGAEFTVTLKLAQSEKPQQISAEKHNDIDKSHYKNAHILVVEDNKINQLVAKKQLASLGVKCDFADDGYQAIKHLQQHTPDIILMDLQMPNMDGFTASELIKEDDKLQSIPIVILSASVSKKDKDRASALGIYDFINKPFQQKDLETILEKYL